ncbi:MAG: 23S rRNA pseudouridine1911/1915/1917 synthase [Candidatus Omnitrophota bacterium]
MEPIYEDNHLLVVNKPAGLLVQGDDTGDRTLQDEAKTYLKERYDKPGKVYLGLVHRLDRPVSGIVILARTSKAASRLSEEIRAGRMEKEYIAIVSGRVPDAGDWTDRLVREDRHSRVARAQEEGKTARLTYTCIGYEDGVSRVRIQLITGRHHQIRVQFSHRGHPILGDLRYGSTRTFPDRALALHAAKVAIKHPVRPENMTFEAPPGW